MKKITFILSILLFLTMGCQKQKNEFSIEGIIEKNENDMIGIHYPLTGIKKLDQQIETYIFDTKNSFHKQIPKEISLHDSELNIDYEYWTIGNRYHNIVLTTFMTTFHLAHPIHDIKTFVYDELEKKFLNLTDIANINKSNIKKELIHLYKDSIIINQLESTLEQENLKFTFKENNITLYFNPYEITAGSSGIIKYQIPYENFKIEIKNTETAKNTFQYHPINKKLSITKPTIALTFDDGPSKYTKEIVNLLKEYNANATFFILGNKVENYQETLEFVLKNGNELGNHSYNHKQLTRLSTKDLKNQIELTNKIVKQTLNYDIQLLRPTYGSITPQLRKKINMDIVLWNVDTKDWKLKNGQKIAKKALTDIEDGKTVLMHDIYKTTVDALKIILPELKKQGYQVVTVSELKEIEKLRNESKNN